jgi:hypothetical protein
MQQAAGQRLMTVCECVMFLRKGFNAYRFSSMAIDLPQRLANHV